MGKFVCILSVILLTFVYRSRADITAVECTVGDANEGDTKCQNADDNAECPGSNGGASHCDCKTDYFLSSDKTQCVQKITAVICTAGQDTTCTQVDENSKCNDGGSNCECKVGFAGINFCTDVITDITCIPGDATCQDVDLNAVCPTGSTTCECTDGHFLSFDKRQCVQKITTVPCTPNDGTEGDAKCQLVDTNSECPSGNMCSCMEGYSGINFCTDVITDITCTSGDTCKDVDSNADCPTDSTTCACTDDYFLSSDKRQCVQKISTVGCTPDHETAGTSKCQGFDTHSECPANGDKCACKAGYKGTDSCAKVLMGGCMESNDCTGTVEHSECSSSTCSCAAGYKEENNICVKARVSDKTCDAGDEDCPVDNSECDDADNTPVCKCSGGYKEDSNDGSTCVKIPAVSETDCNPANNDDTTGESAVCKAVDVNAECPTGTTKCVCKERYKEGNPDSHTCVLKAAESSATSVCVTTSLLVTSMLIYLPRFILW